MNNNPLVEALREIERRVSDCERINLIGKTPDAKMAGTIRAVKELAEAALASSAPTGEREQIVEWLRALAMADLTPGIVAFFGDPWGDDGQRLLGEVADAIARGDHRTQSGEMEGTPDSGKAGGGGE